MKLMKTVKKILALSTGAVMVGATVLSAGAANLNEYPAPWVQNGKFNGLIVVGDNPGTSPADVLGAIDIAIALQYAARVPITVQTGATGTTSGVSVVGGEAWRVQTSSNDLEISERGGQIETIRNVAPDIGMEELPNLLADGTFSTADEEYDYEQILSFDEVATDPLSRTVVLAESSNDANPKDEVGLFFYIKEDDQIARYVLDFDSSAESDITNSDGDTNGVRGSGGNILYSFEGETITMLGKEWNIIKAISVNDDMGVKLTLMGGADSDSLSQGESKTYTVAGKTYDVTLDLVTDDKARFIVNGEVTRNIKEGNTYTLDDDSLIGVREVIFDNFADGSRVAEFYIGANKVELQDDDISDSKAGEDLIIGNDKVKSAKVTITGDNSAIDRIEIRTIELNITADESVFLPDGGMLSEQLKEPGVLMDAWDIQYAGLENAATEDIIIDGSQDEYVLEFTDGDGEEISLTLVSAVGDSILKLGESRDDLILHETQPIGRNDYFIVSDTGGDGETYVLQYTGADDGDMEFEVLGGDTIEMSYDETITTARRLDSIDVGGKDYAVYSTSDGATADDFAIQVDLDGDTTLATSFTDAVISITTNAGALITITGVTEPMYRDSSSPEDGTADGADVSITVTIDTVDTDDYDNLNPSPVGLTIDASEGEVGASLSTVTGNLVLSDFEEVSRDKDIAYTSLGAMVTYDSGDQPSLSIVYPTAQLLPQLFVVTPEVQITSTGGGTTSTESGEGTFYETNKISVGVAVLASEVTDIRAQNAIVVGGPCANKAAAELMGNPQPCGKDFTPNTALIRLFEHPNGNVAMLVAGYNAIDTRRAARVVAEYETWQGRNQFSGMDLQITGTSFTNIQVSTN